jgi:transcriptional regulator with XRE-family HTH domain
MTSRRQQDRSHGTRACYVWGPSGQGPGCHCDDCTEANRVANANRNRQIAYGQWQPFTDAAPVRQHMQELSAAGIGRRRMMALTGISSGSLTKLLYGQRGSPPSSKIRTETAEKILAIQPETEVPPKFVDSAGARHRLQALAAARWSQSALAERLGDVSQSTITAIMRGDQITPKTDQAVRELYSRLWDQPPPERRPSERSAAARAGNHARRMGWAPPAAWEDMELDRPGGKPVEGWQPSARVRHRSADLAEDAEWIMRTEGGGLTRAAERLGVRRDTLEHAMSRAAEQGERQAAAQRAAAADGAEPARVVPLPVTREPEDDREVELAELEAG